MECYTSEESFNDEVENQGEGEGKGGFRIM